MRGQNLLFNVFKLQSFKLTCSQFKEIFEQFTEDKEDYIAVPFKEDPKEELAATLENSS